MLLVVVALVAVALLLFAPYGYVQWSMRPFLRAPGGVLEPAPVAIVFGAGLWRSGAPTPVLADRVTTAVELYEQGVVEKILLSGDNSDPGYNEPEAMRQLALRLGVPEEALVLDFAGRRSYDTCYRARFVFGVQRAIAVTQAYHLPRAVYSCRELGIDTQGAVADRRRYSPGPYLYWRLREVAATFGAVLDLHVLHSQPILGPLQPIAAREPRARS
jgi:vancomycin permeability regulator SanA